MLQGDRSTCGARVRRLGAICLLVIAPVQYSEIAVSQDLRIENVTVVSPDSAREIESATVTIHDGRIQSISTTAHAAPASGPTAAQTLDGTNLYLIPGLIDSHVHLGGIPGMTDEQEKAHPDIALAARDQFPRSYLYSGFTTLVDLISTPEEMARWKSHDPKPDTFFCGGATLMDGYPSNYLPKESRYTAMPYMLLETRISGSPLPPGVRASEHTPQAVVTHMKTDGAICVKTFFERGFGGVRNLPVPQADTIRALVRAAHAAGLPVLMHANSLEAQQFALDTGVDIIAHGLWNTDEKTRPGEFTAPEKSVLDRVIAAHVGWQPTLQVLYGLRNLFDNATLADPKLTQVLPRSLIDWYRTSEGRWFRDSIVAETPELAAPAVAANMLLDPINRAAAATGYMAQHHARLLFGTDTPSSPTYANPPGLNGWMEMRHLADAGVTPEQIFQAATLSNARALKLDREIGTVQVGKRANLLLVRADPRKTIQAYQEIAKVILGGRVLDPSMLAPNRP
jgi:imidazolonepropionase-like amidohydrolase